MAVASIPQLKQLKGRIRDVSQSKGISRVRLALRVRDSPNIAGVTHEATDEPGYMAVVANELLGWLTTQLAHSAERIANHPKLVGQCHLTTISHSRGFVKRYSLSRTRFVFAQSYSIRIRSVVLDSYSLLSTTDRIPIEHALETKDLVNLHQVRTEIASYLS